MNRGKNIRAQDLYRNLVSSLKSIYGESEGGSIANLLLEELAAVSRNMVLLNQPIQLSDIQQQQIDKAVQRLQNWEPVQQVLGFTWFYNRRFKVNPSVLIPRQETEELVHLMITEAETWPSQRILEIGAGSGCIAITLQLEIASSSCSATDTDAGALLVARENAQNHDARIEFYQSDVLKEELPGQFDVLVSNPPYVCESERSSIKKNVLDFEPGLALFVPDQDPLIFYRRILKLAQTYLIPEGRVYFEINERFGEEIRQLFLDFGYHDILILQDLNGKPRMARAIKSGISS